MQREHLEKVISSYQHIGNVVYDAATSATADDAHSFIRWFLLDMPVVPYLLAFHSIYAAVSIHRLTKGRQFWLKSLVLTAFAAFGGSTLANVLSGQPAPLFTVSSNYMMSYVTLAWYFINHSEILCSILSFRPILAIVAFGATAAKVRSILSFMDDFVVRFPEAVLGAIVLSGLAGSGGALFVTIEKIVQNGLGTASELSSPGWGFKVAYVAALVYYVGTDPVGWIAKHVPFEVVTIEREEMRFAISLSLCVHAALETLYGKDVNALYPIEQVLYALTGLKKRTEEPEGAAVSESGAEGESSNKDTEISNKDTETSVKGVRAEGLRRRGGQKSTA